MKNIIATFENTDQVEKAIGALRDHGIDKDHLSLISGEGNLERLYTSEAAKNAKAHKKSVTTTTANDAATGALKGSGIGLGIGALAGLASLFIPGYGLVFGGGALMTASMAAMGSGIAGGVAGSVEGFLKDQGVDSSLVKKIQTNLNNGGSILSVESDASDVDTSTIKKLLTKYGGQSVSVLTNRATVTA